MSEDYTSVADFTIKTHDTAPFIAQTLLDWTGNPVDIAGASVIFVMSAFGEDPQFVLSEPASNDQTGDHLTDGSTGYVSYEWQDGDTDVAGAYVAEWEVTFLNGEVETFPNGGHVDIAIEEHLGGVAS